MKKIILLIILITLLGCKNNNTNSNIKEQEVVEKTEVAQKSS